MRCWRDPARARDSLLLHPPPRRLVADQAEGLDGDPALGGASTPVLEGVAEVVCSSRSHSVEGAHREDGSLPGRMTSRRHTRLTERRG